MTRHDATAYADRQEILGHERALADLLAEAGMPGRRVGREFLLCKEEVAAFFEIGEPAIDELVASLGNELTRCGFRVLRGEELRAFVSAVRVGGGEALARRLETRPQAQVFTPLSLADMALALPGSARADALRDRIFELRAKGYPRSKAAAPAAKPRFASVARPPAPPAGSPPIRRAISIRQPYVEQILLGEKTEEYRSMPTSIRERVYLYASLRAADDEEAWEESGLERGSLPVGLIVGSVEIAGCYWNDEMDCFAYPLENPLRLEVFLKATNQPQPRFWIPRF